MVKRKKVRKSSYHYFKLGNELFENERYKYALMAYTRAIELDPNRVKAWIGKGNIYMEFHEFDKALEVY